eukprot:14984743-Alexandrium_andersonii.AAC.1
MARQCRPALDWQCLGQNWFLHRSVMRSDDCLRGAAGPDQRGRGRGRLALMGYARGRREALGRSVQ